MASEIAIEAIRPARTGSSRPRRSDQRPSSGLCAAPVAALTTQKTVMPRAPTPTASRLSGPSTVRQPKSSEGSAISQTPEITLALRSEETRSRSGWRSGASRCRHARRPDREHDAEGRDARERDGPPGDAARRRRRAGPAARRSRPRRARCRAARRGGRAAPPPRATPDRRSTRSQRPMPCAKRRRVQQPDLIRQSEAGAARRQDEHPDDRGRAQPGARREPCAAERADGAAGRVRAAEDADAGLGEPELAATAPAAAASAPRRTASRP